jgi:hypothetical protein
MSLFRRITVALIGFVGAFLNALPGRRTWIGI